MLKKILFMLNFFGFICYAWWPAGDYMNFHNNINAEDYFSKVTLSDLFKSDYQG